MYSFQNILKLLKTNTNLLFNKKIDEDSAQGSCGILLVSEEKINENENEIPKDCRDLISNFKTNSVFYKYGNNGHNCTLSRQEYVISQSLMSTCAHLPNFLRSIMYMKNSFLRKDKCLDPFDVGPSINKNNLLCTDLVIFEYIENNISFYKLLKNKNLSDDFINSMIMQIFICLICAQQNIDFVHNDLHANNILILKCDKNLKILYKLIIGKKETFFLIPTYGYFPVIIDYGYSYTKECENMSVECLDLDNYGLITYKFDSLSDFIRLSVVLAGKNINKDLSLKIKSLFKDLPISMENSWEKIIEKDTLWYVEKIFLKILNDDVKYKKNKKFYDQILRLLIRKITLPIKYDESYNNVDVYKELTTFFIEWYSIEKWLKYDCEKIYIFRELIDSTRRNCDSIEKISIDVSNGLEKLINKIIPLEINWECLVNSLKLSTGYIENIIYKKIKELNLKRKKQLYTKLISGENMFLEYIPYLYKNSKKKLVEDDIILLIDNIDKSNMIIKPNIKDYYSEKQIYKLFQDD